MRHEPLRLSIAAALALGLVVASACNRSTGQNAVPAGTEQAVEKAADRLSDGWITTKIQAQYFADSDIKARHIDVTTRNGVVTVAGTVPSETARTEALALARRTDGVTEVVDQLRVAPEAAQDRAARAEGDAAAQKVDDSFIATTIQAKYFADPHVKARSIDVRADRGVVTLRGEVDSDAARQRALAIARDTQGVRMVQDQLRVGVEAPVATTGTAPSPAAPGIVDRAEHAVQQGVERLDDAQITARVQARFFLDDQVKARRIDVDTANGVVTLSGTVTSNAEHQQALTLARGTAGVARVVDRLDVHPEATAPAAGPGGTFGEKMARGRAAAGDEWIATKVQAKFFADAQVKGRDIDVEVTNGVVTLSGTVPTPAARLQALELARNTDGVTRVVDRLVVRQ